MMEAASASETSVKFYHTVRRNKREDRHLHTRRREKLKQLRNRVQPPISHLFQLHFNIISHTLLVLPSDLFLSIVQTV
jgi:hypothetical protein